MKNKNRIYFFLIVILMAGFLPACSAATTQAPTPTLTSTATALETVKPSVTLAPSQTDTVTPSRLPSSTTAPTATPTATASSTPRPTFAGFQVTYAENTNYGLQLGFHIPGIKESYRLTVNGVEYKCDLNNKSVDSLFCYGAPFNQGQTVKLAFFMLDGDKAPVFETNYTISLAGTPTLNPETLVAAGKACLIRGVHVTCETEYRRNGNTYCTVSSCFDLCGYYYSKDDCPPGAENNGAYPITGTPPMPGNK
jgi:hypothetical protein